MKGHGERGSTLAQSPRLFPLACFGMARSSGVWRDVFAAHAANRYAADDSTGGHGQRQKAQSAGSMDTTLNEDAAFLAGVLRGEGLSASARQHRLSAQIALALAG